MEAYIQGNREAWEEAFELRSPSYGANITSDVAKGNYSFFNAETAQTLKRYDLKGKTIGQFCCNNGRELLSLVKSAHAKAGLGFDIARNMVAFANEKARELNVPCTFHAANILELGDAFNASLDAVIITIGALCWFKNLKDYFAVVSRCMKKNAVIIINEQHPMTNMLALPEDSEYDAAHPQNCVFSYFEHEWIGNNGMDYMTGRDYPSKTFTDYTHAISDIVGAMCASGMVITDMREMAYDISGSFKALNDKGLPLSLILEGRKVRD